MVRKRVLVPLLAAAALLTVLGSVRFLWWFGQCVQQRPEPEAHGDSSSDGAVCAPPAAWAVVFFLDFTAGVALRLCYFFLADDDEEEAGEASGSKKAGGHVAIRDCGSSSKKD